MGKCSGVARAERGGSWGCIMVCTQLRAARQRHGNTHQQSTGGSNSKRARCSRAAAAHSASASEGLHNPAVGQVRDYASPRLHWHPWVRTHAHAQAHTRSRVHVPEKNDVSAMAVLLEYVDTRTSMGPFAGPGAMPSARRSEQAGQCGALPMMGEAGKDTVHTASCTCPPSWARRRSPRGRFCATHNPAPSS